MASDNTEWNINLDAGDEEVYAVLRRDRVWNCFAIADLAPPFRAYSRFAVARQARTARWAACLILRHPALTVVSPYGAEDGIEAILAHVDLPERALLQARGEHMLALEKHYRPDPDWREMLRMTVTPETFFAVPSPSGACIERLDPSDLSALMELYALFPENHFNPDQLRDGVFYGAHDGGRIVAAAGTHVVAAGYGVAVLGGIFTHPDERRKGYAGAVTAALVTDLFARGCRDVVLNVAADNTAAIRVYEHLGFRTRDRYWTGQARRVAP